MSGLRCHEMARDGDGISELCSKQRNIESRAPESKNAESHEGS